MGKIKILVERSMLWVEFCSPKRSAEVLPAVNVTLFESRALCRCVQVKMRLCLSREGPSSDMTGVLLRRGKETQRQTQRADSPVKTEITAMPP